TPPLIDISKGEKDMSDDCCRITRRIAKVLGADKFPFDLPESFRNVNGKEPKQIKIDDYAESFGYLLDRLDELIGQFDVAIDVEDTDPTTQGNQTAKVRIGNVAEGIAEIIGLIYGVGMNTKIASEGTVKALVGISLIQKVMTEIDASIEEIVDHLEIPIKETEREIPLQITPESQNIDAFLKDSKFKVKVIERLEGKKHPTIQDQLDILLQAATIIKARGFKKLDHRIDIGQQLMDELSNQLRNSDALKHKKDGTFDDFIETVQDNFRNYKSSDNVVDTEKDDNPKIIKMESLKKEG
ncbi:MAG TPA: hypothetical protein VFM18_07250, partial [Methanosarcina sp.]|nr:hypothetical protein [Methanosarcina sp.]